MPRVSFTAITPGERYSREQLAARWGYKTFHALARGVVTPQGTNYIILFVTEEKPADREPYRDKLSGNTLEWEGPTDHFAEQRMVVASRSGDEIHVFYRRQLREPFTYLGTAQVAEYRGSTNRPSYFKFRLP